MATRNNICVLGGGLWGTVLADHLARNGHSARLWEFFEHLARDLETSRRHPHLPHMELSPAVRVTSDLASAAHGATLIVFVLPSAHVRTVAAKLREILKLQKTKPWIVNASKGIEPKTLKTMGEVIGQEIPFLSKNVFTLSGPSFAREVSHGIPTALILAGTPLSTARMLKQIFESPRFLVELSTDRKGVELGGSMKNVLAIGCGILDGMKAGANTKAAFLTRGMAEMGRLMKACGGRVETAYGLAGIGDLIATGTSSDSRNRGLGERLGSGKNLETAMREIPTVMEGVESAQSVHEIIKNRGKSFPLFESVWQVTHQGRAPQQVLDALGFRSHTLVEGNDHLARSVASGQRS